MLKLYKTSSYDARGATKSVILAKDEGKSQQVYMFDTAGKNLMRGFIISKNGITVSNCYVQAVSDQATNAVIPVWVYGVNL